MIIQTFSLDDLKSGKAFMISDSYSEFRVLEYRQQLDEILSKHHEKERELMKKITNLLTIAVKENSDSRYKVFLNDFRVATKELSEHFDKEEQIVFPLMYVNDKYDKETVSYIDTMVDEHRSQERKVVALQDRMYIFDSIEYGAIRTDLQKFFVDLSIHITKEDEITYPSYIDSVTNLCKKS